MGLKSLLDQQAVKIKFAEDNPPKILRPEYADVLWPKFLNTRTVKDVKSLYGTDADHYLAVLFVNYLLNVKSDALMQGKAYEPSRFSVLLLTALLRTVNRKLTDFFTRKNLLIFQQSSRKIDVEDHYSPFLHAAALPSVNLYQNLIINKSMDATLHSMKGFLYPDFPDALKFDKVYSIDDLHKVPNFKWFYLGNTNGIVMHLKRIDKEIICLKITFDIPFVLPLGKFTKGSFHNLLVRSLNSFRAGY